MTLPLAQAVQAALQRKRIGVSAVQLASTAFAAPSFASQLCLLQAKGYCTGVTIAALDTMQPAQ